MSSFFNGSYGLSIILLILIIRGLLFPFAVSQYKNQLKIKKIQPELKKMREKYKDKKDSESKQKEMEETMELYKKHDIKFFSTGCLPLIIQMPVFITLFYACTKTPEINSHNFLWFNLGSKDPMFILPILAGIIIFIQMQISLTESSANSEQEKMMQNYMKMMGYALPLITLISGLTLPAVVSFYLAVSGILGLLQTIILRLSFRKEKQQIIN